MKLKKSTIATLVFLIAVAASCPLVLHRWLVTDDGLFHLYRLASLGKHWRSGYLYPRWFADFAFGYGHPVLNYYAPLAYYLALPWHLILKNAASSMGIVIFLGFWIGAIGMFRLVDETFESPAAGLLAAAAYTFFPYHLTDFYTRGAIPEGLAFVWTPWVLWAWRKAIRQERGDSYAIVGGLAYAALVLTHNLSAYILTPFLILWVLMVAWSEGKWKGLVRKVIPAWLLALASTAFYWLPALAELKWVQLGVMAPGTGYRHHFSSIYHLLQPTFFHQYVPAGHPAVRSIPFVIAILAIPGAVAGLRNRKWRAESAWFLIAALVGGALISSSSDPIWGTMGRWLAVLQYPWRFLFLVALGLSPLAGASVLLIGGKLHAEDPQFDPEPRWVAALVLGLVVFAASARLPIKPMADPPTDASAMWQTDYRNRQIGATWTAEFVPVTVKADRTAVPNDPAHSESSVGTLKCAPDVTVESWRPLDRIYLVDTACGVQLSLHQFDFPDWQVLVDGHPVRSAPIGELGVIGWKVPSGRHEVEVEKKETPARKAGDVLCAIGAFGFLIWEMLRAGRLFRWSVAAIAAIMALVLLSLFPFHFAAKPLKADYDLGNRAQLIGYEIQGEALPGGELKVRLFWLSLAPMQEDYKVFVHFYNPTSLQVVAQHDGTPVGGFTPTKRWYPGEILEDDHVLRLPEGLPPGRYEIGVGMYRLGAKVQNLHVIGYQFPGDRIPLAKIEVPSEVRMGR